MTPLFKITLLFIVCVLYTCAADGPVSNSTNVVLVNATLTPTPTPKIGASPTNAPAPIINVPTIPPTAPDCKPEDIGSMYSDCDKSTNTMTVLYYKKIPCKKELPSPSITVPCNLNCDNGQILEAPNTACTKCPPGGVSFSEGININNWSSLSDPNLSTTCIGRHCKRSKEDSRVPLGWVSHPSGEYIHSGNNQPDSVKLVLAYTADVVRESGQVIFTYKVDAEHGSDGLIFYVDSKVVLPLTSTTKEYTTVKYALTHGYHKLEWRYVKNAAISKGKDRAQVKSIQIVGTKHHDSKCTPCQPGTFSSVQGGDVCLPCPSFTFSASNNTVTCQNCPPDQYSLGGATQCIPRPTCQPSDYYSDYTACKNGKRKLTFKLKQPAICKPDPSTAPKDKDQVDCAKCPLGLYRDDQDNCVACSGESEYRSQVDQKCKTCEAGNAAIKYLRYDQDWLNEHLSLPSDWVTMCKEGCEHDKRGFFISNDHVTLQRYIQSGGSPNSGDLNTLRFSVNLYTFGRISFQYEISQNVSDPEESATLSFYVDSVAVAWIDGESGPSSDGSGTFTTSLIPPGNHTLFFGFERFDSYDDYASLKIKNIIIQGESTGASHECEKCMAGFKCSAKTNQFTPCQPGEFSNEGSENCGQCPPGTYNNQYAQPYSCMQCPSGTNSIGHGNVDCIDQCSYNVPGTKIFYDLTKFDSPQNSKLEFNAIGPVNLITNSTSDSDAEFELYISMCNRFNISESTSFCNTNQIGLDQMVDRLGLHSPDSRVLNSYACVQNDDTSFDVGYMPAYTALPDSESSDQFVDPSKRADGIKLEFTSQEVCLSTNETIIDQQDSNVQNRIQYESTHGDLHFYKTIIHFICDPDAGFGKLVPAKSSPNSIVELNSKCKIQLQWNSMYACPICTIYDYETIHGQCDSNGYRVNRLYKKPESKCNPFGKLPNGVDPNGIIPSQFNFTIACPICTINDAELVITKCVDGYSTHRYIWKEPKNCTDGNFKLPEPKVVPCDSVDLSKFAAALILVVVSVVFVGLIAGYVIMYRRHQQLYKNYQMLQESDGKELSEVEVFGRDDDDDDDVSDDDMGFESRNKKSGKKDFDSGDDEIESRV
ncbi:hypothetical protein AKO1_010943 [Acrasis kona]|uniref:MRH domain-containing protein n=1 Tax=Acrasis kona TaxID=1008807 RepID=A0AAW2YSK8_9EUKA